MGKQKQAWCREMGFLNANPMARFLPNLTFVSKPTRILRSDMDVVVAQQKEGKKHGIFEGYGMD